MARLCIEHHYTDGDVGVYYLDEFSGDSGFLDENISTWFESSNLDDPNSLPSHLVIRRDDEAGQALSNTLMRARKLKEFAGVLSRMLTSAEAEGTEEDATFALDAVIEQARILLNTE